jgi:hypothetical protein
MSLADAEPFVRIREICRRHPLGRDGLLRRIGPLATSATAVRLALSAVGAAAIEFSQLIHWQWLDAFRQTTMGALLLGRTFSWWDIVAYWAGILCAGVVDAKVISRAQDRL